jgi:hypothetical protein
MLLHEAERLMSPLGMFRLRVVANWCDRCGKHSLKRYGAESPSIRGLIIVCFAQRDALGALVSLEMGKIYTEGTGDVQEFVDIVSFRNNSRPSANSEA